MNLIRKEQVVEHNPARTASLSRISVSAMTMATNTLFVAKPNKLTPAPSGTLSIPSNAPNVLEVRMFNVGAGEAILITFPTSRAWLIDGGSTNGDAKNRILGEKLAGYLKSKNLKLETLVASHPHKDHVGAVSYLLAKKPKLASKLRYYHTWDPPSKPKPAWILDLESKLGQIGNKAEMINMGDKHREVHISNQAQIHLFAGSGEGAYTSVFMHVHFKKATFFFSGDAECGYEKGLLERYGTDDFVSDVLKITHHGSSTGTGKKFVGAVMPALAIASTSIDGGHRVEEDVKKRLKGCKIIETLKAGDITIRTAGQSAPSGVVYEIATSFRGLFANDLAVPDISQQEPSPPQKTPHECL